MNLHLDTFKTFRRYTTRSIDVSQIINSELNVMRFRISFYPDFFRSVLSLDVFPDSRLSRSSRVVYTETRVSPYHYQSINLAGINNSLVRQTRFAADRSAR